MMSQNLWQDKKTIFNLVMMILCWGSVSFSFFVLSFFMKYMPGNIYLNSIVSGFSCIAFLFSGPMSKRFDIKWILCMSFALAFMSSITLAFLTQISWIDPDHPESFSMIILLTRCGINLAFCMVFVIHTELFPTSFLGTSYGICNFFCRTLTLLAPIVAEIQNQTIPLLCLSSACFIGLVCSASLKKQNKCN